MIDITSLEELLYIQYEQQEKLNGVLPMDRAKQREMAEKFAMYLIDETYSYLDAIAYKKHILASEAVRSTRIVELVDVFKYLLAICWTEGIIVDEFVKAFISKTDVVNERYKQEILSSKIAGFDIDGVLADLKGTSYHKDGPDLFFDSGKALDLEVQSGVPEVLDFFKRNGWGIVLVTARKIHHYRRIESDTYQWLKANNIPYDRVLWGYDKAETMIESGIPFSFFVEDSPKHAIDLATAGIKTFLLTLSPNTVQHENIIPISNINELLYHF